MLLLRKEVIQPHLPEPHTTPGNTRCTRGALIRCSRPLYSSQPTHPHHQPHPYRMRPAARPPRARLPQNPTACHQPHPTTTPHKEGHPQDQAAPPPTTPPPPQQQEEGAKERTRQQQFPTPRQHSRQASHRPSTRPAPTLRARQPTQHQTPPGQHTKKETP